MGNDAYDDREIGSLSNSVQDAKDVSQVLSSLGFDTFLACNCRKTQLTQIVSTFSKKLKQNDVVLIYFSGHAIDVDGVPHLLTKDASAKAPTKHALNLNDLLYQCNKQNDVFKPKAEPFTPPHLLLILDAARSNKVSASGISFGPTLHRPNSAWHTLVLSDAPKMVSKPTPFGRNSVFTAKFLDCLGEVALAIMPVDALFERVSREVETATNGKQRPHIECHRRPIAGVALDGALCLMAPPAPKPTYLMTDCSGDLVFRDGRLQSH